jgi:predicted DsbA family dithiol-disulfide isomerase
VSLSYTLFPLHPDTPPEGVLLSEYFKGRFDIDKAHARMRGLMDAEGLPFHPAERMANTRLAQELGKWGEAKAPGIHDALYRANFVEGRPLSKVETLVDVAREQGLDAEEAAHVLADRTMKDAVDRDWLRSRERGVTGVPTFVAAGRGVVGAQPYEVLEQLVLSAGAKRR